MEYLSVDIFIPAIILLSGYAGREGSDPTNPAETFRDHKYEEFKKRMIDDLEKERDITPDQESPPGVVRLPSLSFSFPLQDL